MEPSVLADLVRTQVEDHRDQDLWDDAVDEDEESRRVLGLIAENFEYVKEDVLDRFDSDAYGDDDEV